MDSDSDNVAETDKYAFLLGSAIRIEDTDQFFSIYDSILPPDLPDSQVEIIKERAREISELPEDNFNSLVCRARDYSLAPAGASMSCPRPLTTHKSRYSYEDEDEGVGSTRMAHIQGGKSETSSCFSTNTMTTNARSSESETRRLEEDSGVYNSSKATSIGSWTDENGSEDEREAADFDYFPPQIKISSGRTLYYDEVHDVETESSNEDVNSPRSDPDRKENRYDGEDGLEMITISSSNEDMPRRSIFQDDFNTSGDSDDDCGRAFNYYSYQTRPKTTCSYKPKFDSFAHTPLSSSLHKGTHVDETISFRTLEEGVPTVSRYAPYQEYGTMSSNHSDRVKVEKTSYKNSPPFGSRDQLNKVANSITPLLSGLSGTEAPTNMPPARKLEVLKSDESKKKKKKKKMLDDQVDENGNPVPLSKDKYKQMREAPSPVIASGKSRSVFDTRPTSNSDGFFELTHRESENDLYRAQEKRKRKKLIKEEVKKSEEIENYVGNKSIEELVDFIGGNNAGVKKAKKPVSTNSEHIPAKTNKVAKKPKDKKQKTVSVNHSLEKVEPKVEDSVNLDSLEVESEEQKNMGNSGAKNEIHINEDRNGVNEIMIDKEIKKKDLLKENDKKIKVKNSVIDSTEINEKKTENEKDISKEKDVKHQVSEEHKDDEIIEEKKKNDKISKPQKKDKIEKHKSDEIVKFNPNSSVNSVKQKNAKNKKTKPSSPTQKLESSSENEMVNHERGSISSTSSNGLVDNKFIFTDIDLQAVPKEDEFRVVEKKKKKPTTKDGQNHYVSANNNKTYPRFLDDKRSLPPSSSNKLTASEGSYVTKGAEIDNGMRDLSPSAFPALDSGKGRVQEGRRNSTGDVPIPSEIALKTQDDSDLESVKSLPATQGSRAADTLTSPRLNMSYARMAASPKQKGEGQDSSGFVDQDEPERKLAVWKGSPTERRHSIGSSPNGKIVSVDNSSATSSVVKGGSQEMLNIDPLPNKIDSSTAKKGQKNSTNVSSMELNDSLVSKTKGSSNIYENQITAKNCANSISSTVQSSGLSHKCDAEVTPSNTRNTYNVNAKTKTTTDAHDIKATKNISNSKALNTSRKTKPCSVIFLDKRLAEPTNNLGITFGFEYDPGDNENVIESKSSGDNVEFRKDSITHSVEPPVTFLSDLEDEILATDQTPSDNSSSSNVINIIRENKDTSRELVHKVAAHVGQLNGIVKASQGQQGHATDKMNKILSKGAPDAEVTNSVNEDQSKDSVETSSQDTNCYKRSKNEVVVYYGENVSTVSKTVSVPSITNGPTHYCGKLIFVPEEEVRRGTFNAHDAVAFLTGEWDVTLLSKDTDSVKVHTEQGAI